MAIDLQESFLEKGQNRTSHSCIYKHLNWLTHGVQDSPGFLRGDGDTNEHYDRGMLVSMKVEKEKQEPTSIIPEVGILKDLQ